MINAIHPFHFSKVKSLEQNTLQILNALKLLGRLAGKKRVVMNPNQNRLKKNHALVVALNKKIRAKRKIEDSFNFGNAFTFDTMPWFLFWFCVYYNKF